MKHVIRHAITVAGISALLALPSANARMGRGGAPMQQSSPSHWGNHWGGGFHGGDRFDHDRFHDRSSFFFFGAFPFGYPYYWPPYYYDYPPYYYDDYYYYGPRYYYDYGPPSSYNAPASGYAGYDGRSYLTLGHDAGKGLKTSRVTWDWFVEYLQAYIINAPSWARDDFRRGFISGYGDDAESTFKKGFQQARQPGVSKSENAPSSEPNQNSQRY